MKVSITTAFSNKGGLQDKVSAISQAEFSHISIDEDQTENLLHCGEKRVDELCSLLSDYHLSVDWVHAPINKISLYTTGMKQWINSLNKMIETVKLAAKLRARSVVVHIFDNIKYIPDNIQKSLIQLKQALQILLDTAYKTRVKIALENLGKKFMNNIILILLEKLPELHLCLDTGHAEITGSWKDFLSPDIISRIAALHIHDNDGISDEHLIPGEGQIDFYRYIKILKEGGYKGVWGIECIQNIGKYTGGLSEIAEKVLSYMKNMLSLVSSETLSEKYNTAKIYSTNS